MNPEKSTKQRKAFIAILALALAGLAVDRLVIGGGATGPGEVNADVTNPAPGSSASAAAPGATTPKPAGLTSRADTLAGRLDRVAKDQRFELLDVDDAFRATDGWVKPATKETATPAVKISETEAFAKRHKLMAVVNNAGSGAAIINNQTVIVGRQIDGFTLVAVTKRTALLEKGGQRVELALPEPNAGPVKMAD